MKVSVFFDGQNFYRSLQRYDESLRVDYDRLAAWITQAAGGPGAIFAGAHYYVGVSSDAPPLVEGFLKGLELRPGYFVKRELRVRRSGRCPACKLRVSKEGGFGAGMLTRRTRCMEGDEIFFFCHKLAGASAQLTKEPAGCVLPSARVHHAVHRPMFHFQNFESPGTEALIAGLLHSSI